MYYYNLELYNYFYCNEYPILEINLYETYFDYVIFDILNYLNLNLNSNVNDMYQKFLNPKSIYNKTIIKELVKLINKDNIKLCH